MLLSIVRFNILRKFLFVCIDYLTQNALTFIYLYDIMIKNMKNTERVNVMEIRYITPDDNLSEISKIYEKSWKHTYKGMLSKRYLNSITEGEWIEKISKCGTNSLVMLHNGEYIGTVSFGNSHISQFDGWAEIFSIYFLPEYTGQGLGIILMNHVIAELRRLGYQHILLFALEQNLSAIHFYEKYGFTTSGIMMKNRFGRKVVNEVMYVYDLQQEYTSRYIS